MLFFSVNFLRTIPEGLGDLIRNGVPDVLRGEVWQYLAKVQIDPDLTQTYRLLLGKVIFYIIFGFCYSSKLLRFIT